MLRTRAFTSAFTKDETVTMSHGILRVNEQVCMDDSISNYVIHSHPPYANASLNKSDEIRLPIQDQNLYSLPSQSSLNIFGQILNQENKASANLHVINNAIAFLFDECRYELCGIVIDRCRNCGITTLLKGLLSFTERDCVRLENAGWNLGGPNIIDKNGYFNVCIPLSMLLGFCEDFKKIIINVRQELVLLRSSTDLNAVVSSVNTEKPKITLHKIVWCMPHLTVSDVEKLQILKHIDRGIDLPIAFRGWQLYEMPVLQQTTMHTWNVKATSITDKPRYVIVAFQTSKKNNLGSNASLFDHCNLTNLKLYLNSAIYPYDNLNLDFDRNQWAILYEMYSKFQNSYYGKNSPEPCLNLKNFNQMAPIVVIDCSQQNETLKSGSVDVRLEFEFAKNVPPNTNAYCLIIHDKFITYNPQKNIIAIK